MSELGGLVVTADSLGYYVEIVERFEILSGPFTTLSDALRYKKSLENEIRIAESD